VEHCCPRYHQAVELIGKRWSGAILAVLIDADRPLRFSELAHAVPQLSDRLLSERLKELEAHGLVLRHCSDDSPRVAYELTGKGRELAPAIAELKAWAQRWMREGEPEFVHAAKPSPDARD
jgi:DNA-binding HxlR family transcriptional regulator